LFQLFLLEHTTFYSTFIFPFDEKNPDDSWKLKRDFPFVFKAIDDFFDKEDVSLGDEIEFQYKRNTYKAIAKILLISH
jgi:hypothetical protein